MNWVFPFEISLLSDWILLWIWEHLIYVLHMNTRGDNGVSYWFTWYVSWHSTRGFPRWYWCNLCIGVDACSCLCFPGRNLGALFEVLCVGLNIMNQNLFWCYFSMNSRIDQTERIALCYFSTNSWIDRKETIALCYSSTNSWSDRSERIAWCYFCTNSRIDWSERIALRWFLTLQTISSYVLR